jgi:hypothetical protein
MMEENFRRALLLSRGDFTTFVTRPLSLGLLIAAALLVVIVALPAVKKTREEAFRRRLIFYECISETSPQQFAGFFFMTLGFSLQCRYVPR